jgi:hypothetical protein
MQKARGKYFFFKKRRRLGWENGKMDVEMWRCANVQIWK